MAPDERVKDLRETAPAIIVPAYAIGAVSSIGEDMLHFSPGDLFLVSAMTGAVLLVEIGFFIILGVL